MNGILIKNKKSTCSEYFKNPCPFQQAQVNLNRILGSIALLMNFLWHVKGK